MTINEYQKLAQRTSPDDHNKLLNGCMGLAGECGEVCDVMKKALFQGHALDREHMIEELGDCAWYLAEAASGLGVSLEDILLQNIAKLKRRYPAGFDPERSMNRAQTDAGQEDAKMLERKTVSMCVSSDYCRWWNDALKAAEDVVPHWIRLSERRPEANQIVILCGHKIHSDAQFVLMRQVDGYGVFELSTDDIFTHWMPLPDAPEVDDE